MGCQPALARFQKIFENIIADRPVRSICLFLKRAKVLPRRRRLNYKSFSIVFSSMFFILVLAYNSTAIAGILTISTQTTVRVQDGRLFIEAKVQNTGNVPAYDVQACVVAVGRRLRGPVKPLLGVNETDTFHFETSLSGTKKGRYPLTVIVDFHDANDYPFSAVSGTTFQYGENANSDLLCLAHDLIMDKKGGLRCEIKNPGFGSKNILATLALPKELSTPQPQIDFRIPSSGEINQVFQINNFSALPGAIYPVFCYFEYNSGNMHHTAVARSVVKIRKKENWFRRTRRFWIAVAAVLGLSLFLYQFKRKFVSV